MKATIVLSERGQEIHLTSECKLEEAALSWMDHHKKLRADWFFENPGGFAHVSSRPTKLIIQLAWEDEK